MKKMSLIFRSLIFLAIILQMYGTAFAVDDSKSFCSWININKRVIRKCDKDQFQCKNSDKCIKRSYYCDNENDCDDNSDEVYCHSDSCSGDPFYVKCPGYSKCIPFAWVCNGLNDCQDGADERNCGTPMALNAVTQLNSESPEIDWNKLVIWLYNQRLQISDEKWGTNVDKIALIHHYLANYFDSAMAQNETNSEIIYELKIQLLSRLTKVKLQDIPSTELASYLNAFLVTCINPRNFHGYDIIQELRYRVDRENYTNPYVLLSLCNAGETMTESDKMKLESVYQNEHRTFWADMQSVVVMALSCAKNQAGNEVDLELLNEMILELKQLQYRNGTVVNLQTTALVMQALISANSERDPDNFDEIKALQELVRNFNSDGSFGDLMDALLITPVLLCKSLADINSDHCHYGSTDEISALENLSRRSGPKIRVQYSIWIGNEKDLERTLVLRVPQNMSLYGVMEIAAEVDSRFKFDYSVKNRKPYINSISGMRDSPLIGEFWFLYVIQNEQPALSNKSPADIIPKDNDHYVMWYRRGTWID